MRTSASTLKEGTRNERIGLRLASHLEDMLEHAADLTGDSLSGFVLASTLEQARKVIAWEEALVLGGRDRERFFELLDNPPPANASLRKALRAYRAVVADGQD
ncbi:MAG: DUF1778 domain-containing protein [Candidatus Competibacteraceae bacterium]